MLYPLSFVYLLIHRIKQTIDRNRQYKAPLIVISIGNITVGGSGKTPLVIAIAKYLISKGISVACSHRGYKGMSESGTSIIINPLHSCGPAQIGDEAYLLYINLPHVPILVGQNRKKVIQSLVRNYPEIQAVILDDSFQNKSVYHDLDIVVVSAEQGFGNGFLLPAGFLRDRIDVLDMSVLCMIIDKNGAKLPSYLIDRLDAHSRLSYGSIKPACLFDESGHEVSLTSFTNSKIVLCSGIGNPSAFEESIISLGIIFQKHFIYPDHYSFTKVDELNRYVEENIIDWVICTQKDFIKLKDLKLLSYHLAWLSIDIKWKDDCLIKTIDKLMGLDTI